MNHFNFASHSQRLSTATFRKLFVFKQREYESEELIKGIKEEDDFIEESYDYLPEPMASIVILALADCCDQIHILGGFEKEDQMKSSINLKGVQQITEDFHVNDPIYDTATALPFLKAFHQIKLKKLTEDSLFIKNVLTLLKQEIKYNSNYTVLTELIDDLHNIKDEESNLMEDQIANLQKMIDLKGDLENEEKESMMRLQALNEEITQMRDTTEDIYFENIIRTRYVRYWEKARNQQNHETHAQSINELVNTIIKFKSEMEKEERINKEIEDFLERNEKDLSERIERWCNRYDRDLERRQVEMQILREKRIDQENDFLELEGVYLLHKYEIEQYLTYKEVTRQEQERLEYLGGIAIKIQAWWRGLMVRLKLGPFNPKKKKGRRGKEADKGKKDKKK